MSPHRWAWPQTLADLVAEPGRACLCRCAGAGTDRVGLGPAWRRHHGGNGSKPYARPVTVPHGHVVPPVVLVSPQKVRKTSINVHHQRTPEDSIRAGQGPYGALWPLITKGPRDGPVQESPAPSSPSVRRSGRRAHSRTPIPLDDLTTRITPDGSTPIKASGSAFKKPSNIFPCEAIWSPLSRSG